MKFETNGSSSGNSRIWGLSIIIILAVLGIAYFWTHVQIPAHKEVIEPVAIPTLGGFVVEQVVETAQEGFDLGGEVAVEHSGGFHLVEQQELDVVTYDDLPVFPEESFNVIAQRVKEAMTYEDSDMLDWDLPTVMSVEIMSELFNPDGTPKEGVTARWHGYFAKWIMLYRPEWLSINASSVEPAVTYWTVYLQLRAHVPEEQTVGAAPWEWSTRPNWLD